MVLFEINNLTTIYNYIIISLFIFTNKSNEKIVIKIYSLYRYYILLISIFFQRIILMNSEYVSLMSPS